MRRGPAAVFVIISAWMLEQFASSIENSTVNLSASFSMHISTALNQIGKGLKPKCGKEYELLTAVFSSLVLFLLLRLLRLLLGLFTLALASLFPASRFSFASLSARLFPVPPALSRGLPRPCPLSFALTVTFIFSVMADKISLQLKEEVGAMVYRSAPTCHALRAFTECYLVAVHLRHACDRSPTICRRGISRLTCQNSPERTSSRSPDRLFPQMLLIFAIRQTLAVTQRQLQRQVLIHRHKKKNGRK